MGEPTAAPATPVAPVTSSDVSKAPASTSKADANVAPKAAAAPAVKVDENGVAADAPKKIYKLNVNGKEVEYDASNEDKMKADLQKVFGIEEKARTTAQKVDMADKLIGMLQTDPRGFEKQCKLAGIDPTKLATDILYNQIRLQNMTPEQRELEEYKEREAESKALKDQQEADAKVAEANQKTQEWAQKFEKACETALKANQIPKTRLSLALIAQYVDAGLAEKKEYSVEQVLPYVARDLKEIHLSTMGKLEGDELLDYLGESLSNKVAKARVDRYKRTTANQPPAGQQSNGNPVKKKDDISHLKGKAYWAALRRQKSEEGIGLHPGAPGNP
jgi:rRNA maturation endonuclease Nob1